MSEAPGHKVVIGERAASPTAASSASTGFVAGIFQRGSTTEPVLVTSITDAVNKTGERQAANATAYDTLEALFREGATHVYLSREVGAAAVIAKKTAVDASSKKTLEFLAKSPGVWGNNLKVVIVLSGGKITIQVQLSSVVVETSPELTTNSEAVAWSLGSAYVNIVDVSAAETGGIAKSQTLELAEGADKLEELGTTSTEVALARFTRDLGPGQVLVPGGTTEAIHKAALTHCSTNNRRALLNLPVSATAAEHVARGQALRGSTARFGALIDGWAVVPGVSLGTFRKVPMAGVYGGLIARVESEGYGPNTAAAGKHGKARFALELVNPRTDVQRAELNDAGVIGSIMVRGTVTVYGNVSLVNQTTEPNWKPFSGSRLIMAAAALAGEVLENYDFAQIDGHGYVFKELEGELSGTACMPFYLANELYGATPAEAFVVNTGPDVNTPESIAREEIKAQIALRVSPHGEHLTAEIVKVPITEELA